MSDEQQPASREELDDFESSFSHERTSEFRCDCGKVFWDCYNSGCDWEEGDIERLQADPNATAVQYAIDIITIDGRQFANACSCWEKRASRIIGWLEDNRESVVAFYKKNKERRLAEAQRLAVTE